MREFFRVAKTPTGGCGVKDQVSRNHGPNNTTRGFFPMFEDKVLVCKDCGAEFVFTAGEQEFYAEKGFRNEPVRCKACRGSRKAASRGSERVMYDAVCAQCGAKTKIPFEPKNDRPIYCSECFAARRG